MNNLFIGSIVAGILILKSANGMSNSTQQYTPNSSTRNVSNHNIGDNEIFLPVMNRRSSVSALELTSSIPQYIPNNSVRNNSSGNRRFSVSTRELQQNRQELQSLPNSINGQCSNQFYGIQQDTMNGQYINQSCSVQQNVFKEINGNTQENANLLPILGNINSIDQSIGQGTNANLTSEQYNRLGYFLPAERNNSSNPDFTLSEVLQLVELLTEIIRKEQQESSNFKWLYEQLKNQNANLERYTKDLDIALQEAIRKQKNQQDKIFYLEQQNENNQTEIAKLKKQITESKNEITKEKMSHETEVNNLKEQLKREKQLNAVLDLNTAPISENKLD